MNAPVQLPSDGDPNVKELDLIQRILKTGKPKTEPVEAKRSSEPQFGMPTPIDASDIKT
jgi:hypothetical protein